MIDLHLKDDLKYVQLKFIFLIILYLSIFINKNKYFYKFLIFKKINFIISKKC